MRIDRLNTKTPIGLPTDSVQPFKGGAVCSTMRQEIDCTVRKSAKMDPIHQII